MKILVIHQVPYRKISYHLGIDHERHDVTYIGRPASLRQIPGDLRCSRIPLSEDDDLVAGVTARVQPSDGYQKVLSLSEFGILEAVHIRRHLGLPGPSAGRIELVRDKVRMKETLAGSGIRFPRFVGAPPACGPLPWSGKTVLKPRSGASSEGVMVLETAREALSAYRKLPDPENYQLEEHIEGDILHIDGLMQDGRFLELAASRYVNKPVEFAGGLPLGSYQIPLTEAHRDLAREVSLALGIEEGCVHLEAFHTADDELVFLEVANRVGGAGVVTAHERRYGVHLPSHEIAVRLGLERPPSTERSGRYHGWLAFPGHHLPAGTAEVTLPAGLAEHPCVDQLYVLPPDRPLPGHITYQEWECPVFIEASHRDAEELGRFLRACADAISVVSGNRVPAELGGAA
ncbi:acetyl-CoA carboxylase biotin carboxylase subunit family protein [Streptomyces sp. NPDC001922]|uniref:ATP-grasp domain-containing protein n=1 Tax=Streptomyces sp. NPDC001922 TaxID=3364624 RepID=UPI0036B1AD51